MDRTVYVKNSGTHLDRSQNKHRKCKRNKYNLA